MCYSLQAAQGCLATLEASPYQPMQRGAAPAAAAAAQQALTAPPSVPLDITRLVI
jgi:hypothetical protein